MAGINEEGEQMCCDGSGRSAAEHRAEAGFCCVDTKPEGGTVHSDYEGGHPHRHGS